MSDIESIISNDAVFKALTPMSQLMFIRRQNKLYGGGIGLRVRAHLNSAKKNTRSGLVKRNMELSWARKLTAMPIELFQSILFIGESDYNYNNCDEGDYISLN